MTRLFFPSPPQVLPETAVVSVKKTGFQIPATQQGVRAVDRSSNVALEELIVPIKKRPFQASNSISINSKKKDSHIQKESKKRGSSIKQMKEGDASKSIKDFPNAPKKPLNAYMYFGEENRKGMQSDCSTYSWSESDYPKMTLYLPSLL